MADPKVTADDIKYVTHKRQDLKPYKGQISDWKIRTGYDGEKFVVGRPSGHPDFENWIITSPIVKMEKTDPYTNGRDGYYTYEVETKNSHYELIGEEAEHELVCPAENYAKHGISF